MRAALLIAPQHVGAVMGLNTSGAFLAAVVLPYIKDTLVPVSNSPESWRHVMYFVIAVLAFGAIVYLIFGSAEKQNWNEEDVIYGERSYLNSANYYSDDDMNAGQVSNSMGYGSLIDYVEYVPRWN